MLHRRFLFNMRWTAMWSWESWAATYTNYLLGESREAWKRRVFHQFNAFFGSRESRVTNLHCVIEFKVAIIDFIVQAPACWVSQHFFLSTLISSYIAAAAIMPRSLRAYERSLRNLLNIYFTSTYHLILWCNILMWNLYSIPFMTCFSYHAIIFLK